MHITFWHQRRSARLTLGRRTTRHVNCETNVAAADERLIFYGGMNGTHEPIYSRRGPLVNRQTALPLSACCDYYFSASASPNVVMAAIITLGTHWRRRFFVERHASIAIPALQRSSEFTDPFDQALSWTAGTVHMVRH